VRILFLLLAASVSAADWPHWRGAERNSHSSEASGWDAGQRLPDKPEWEADFGAGASAPLVINGVLYTLGWQDGKDSLYAGDALTGKSRWTRHYPCPKYGRHATGDQSMY
jgi:outer membrane protein assembly factor BamB